MSRIGKQPIVIPPKTEVSVKGDQITVKGPLGEIRRQFKSTISVAVEGDHVRLTPSADDKETGAMWGTVAAHIKNMIAGVNKAFEKELILEGVGFKSEIKGKELVLALGFSHPVVVPVPDDLKVKAEKNIITVTGINLDRVGEFSAKIRALKKPEPYKGKGFRYRGEVIRRKEGKKAV